MLYGYRNAISIGILTTLTCIYVIIYQSNDSLTRFSFNSNRLDNFLRSVSKSKVIKLKQSFVEEKLKVDNVSPMTKGECYGMLFPIELLQIDSWSRIDDNKTVYVYSAYTVDEKGSVHAIGASIIPPPTVFCQYWHTANDNTTYIISVHTAFVTLLPRDHGLKYIGVRYECPASAIPVHYVSFTISKCEKPLNLLKVSNAISPKSYKYIFTVCLKPLYYEFDQVIGLVEWIEFNMILGAEKFFVYIYSIANITATVLAYFVKQGIVEIVQWNLPMKSYTLPKTDEPKKIHSNNMVAAIHDCRLRNKAQSEFIVNIDYDEFIIPRVDNQTTWHDMMKQLSPGYDTYNFRNVFFRKDWISEPEMTGNRDNNMTKKYSLVTLKTVMRESKIWGPKSRSKYFTRTSNESKVLMIHEVRGGQTLTVPVHIGMLHHYRTRPNPKKPLPKIHDDIVLTKYGVTLIDRFQNTWNRIQNLTN